MTVEAQDEFDAAGKAFQLRHMALRNALYHIARRRWLDGWSRAFNLVIILGGTGTAAEITRGNEVHALWLGGSIALVGALQLVFDFTGRARSHEILQRRYFNLMADIECLVDPTRQNCVQWEAEISRAAADEPPHMRALDAIADNQATNALYGGRSPRLAVTPWQSFTRHLLAHNGGQFPVDSGWQPSHG
jgi:hypothetical protein